MDRIGRMILKEDGVFSHQTANLGNIRRDEMGNYSTPIPWPLPPLRGKGNEPKIWVIGAAKPPQSPKFSDFLPCFLGREGGGETAEN
jgi:hypothetical protein